MDEESRTGTLGAYFDVLAIPFALALAGLILVRLFVVPPDSVVRLDEPTFRSHEWELLEAGGNVLANMMKMDATGDRARGLSGRFSIDDENALHATLTKPPRAYHFPLSEARLVGGRLHVAGRDGANNPVTLRARMSHPNRLLLCLAGALVLFTLLTRFRARVATGLARYELVGLSGIGFLALAVYCRYLFTLQVNGLSWWMRGTAFRHVRNGLAYTKGIDVNSDSPAPLALGVLGGHHPPGLGLLLAGLYGMTGVSEKDLVIIWLVPLLFHGIGAASFYLLLRRLASPMQALVGLSVYLFLPVSVFHGRVASHESPTLGLAMAGLYCTVTYLQCGGRKWLAGALFSLAVACCMGWPAYFYCAAIGLGAFFFKDSPAARRWIVFASVGAVSTILCALVFLQHQLLLGNIDALLHAASRRIGTGGFEEFHYEPYTWLEWIRQVTGIAVRSTFGLPLIMGALAGVAIMVIHRFRAGWNARWWFLAVTAFVAMLHMVLFHFGSWVHDYWTFYFIPPCAIALSSVPFDVSRHTALRFLLILAVGLALLYSAYTLLPGLGAM